MKKPLLIDLDGVLRLGNDPAPDIIPFLNFLEKQEINACILSNSSIYSSRQIYEYFNSRSIEIKLPIITAIDAAHSFVTNNYKKVAVYTSENVIDLFTDILEYETPEAILIGDIGELWNYKLMQTIFEYVRSGAKLITVHKNKFWNKSGSGIQLDSGPFVNALEYATNSHATIIGKPSQIYFQSALKKLGFNKDEQFIMIGDDLETDIYGSKKLNAETILIYTGKTTKPIEASEQKNVDFEAKNLIEIIEILKTYK